MTYSTFNYTQFQVVKHKKYKRGTFDYDIGLLKLLYKITFKRDNIIAPICLPADPSAKFEDVNATVIGWGGVYFGNYIYFNN